MVASVEQGVAWQIRLNRMARGMSQKDLADRMETKQSAISRLEDPSYGAQSLETLMEVARAFDCALIVKFAGYSVLAIESEHLSEGNQLAKSFDEEWERV